MNESFARVDSAPSTSSLPWPWIGVALILLGLGFISPSHFKSANLVAEERRRDELRVRLMEVQQQIMNLPKLQAEIESLEKEKASLLKQRQQGLLKKLNTARSGGLEEVR